MIHHIPKARDIHMIALIQWIGEVNHFCRGIPVVLVGCKKDLRHDPATIDFLRKQNQQPVATAQVSTNLTFTATIYLLAHDVPRALAGLLALSTSDFSLY